MRWAVLLFGLWTALLRSLPGCTSDGDDDDDQVIDNDAADDDQADDDAGDDDASDDDASDDDQLEGLMVIGVGEDRGETLYVFRGSQWQERPFPPAFSDNEGKAGPSFFAQGERGDLACNRGFEGLVGFVYIHILTRGYEWIVYTPAEGWHTDGAPPATGLNNNAGLVFAPQPNAMWVYSFFEHLETDHGWPGYSYVQLGNIYDLNGWRPDQEWGGSMTFVTALYMTGTDYGLAAARSISNGCRPLTYDGRAWQEQDKPAGFEHGAFLWFALQDENNGHGIWRSG